MLVVKVSVNPHHDYATPTRFVTLGNLTKMGLFLFCHLTQVGQGKLGGIIAVQDRIHFGTSSIEGALGL
jgi:hypothetical protein